MRRGRFMRKVADDSAEREREREFLVQFSRRAGRGRKRKTTWREFGKNGMTRNPRRCARLFRAMYYIYACVARENGRGEWKRSFLSLLTNSSGKVVPSFCFSIGCRFLVGESLKKKKKERRGKQSPLL